MFFPFYFQACHMTPAQSFPSTWTLEFIPWPSFGNNVTLSMHCLGFPIWGHLGAVLRFDVRQHPPCLRLSCVGPPEHSGQFSLSHHLCSFPGFRHSGPDIWGPSRQVHAALSRPVTHHTPTPALVLQPAQTSQHSFQGIYFLHLAQPILLTHSYFSTLLIKIPASKVPTLAILTKDPSMWLLTLMWLLTWTVYWDGPCHALSGNREDISTLCFSF